MNRILALLLSVTSIIATAQERCGTEAHTKSITDNNPSYALARTNVNAQLFSWVFFIHQIYSTQNNSYGQNMMYGNNFSIKHTP